MIKIYVAYGLLALAIILLIVFRKSIASKLQARYERIGVKIPGLNWYNKHNEVIGTEDIVISRGRIPLIGDWGRIYPVLTEEGKPHYVNIVFGGWKNFFKLLIIMGLFAGLWFGVIGDARQYMDGSKYVIVSVDSFNKFCSHVNVEDYVLNYQNAAIYSINLSDLTIDNNTEVNAT